MLMALAFPCLIPYYIAKIDYPSKDYFMAKKEKKLGQPFQGLTCIYRVPMTSEMRKRLKFYASTMGTSSAEIARHGIEKELRWLEKRSRIVGNA